MHFLIFPSLSTMTATAVESTSARPPAFPPDADGDEDAEDDGDAEGDADVDDEVEGDGDGEADDDGEAEPEGSVDFDREIITAIPSLPDPPEEGAEAEEDDDGEPEEDGEAEPDGAGTGLALHPARSASHKRAAVITLRSLFM
jgi:hypothetical protein